MLLWAAGLYGILAYFVARRRREIGLRMALGASSKDVIGLVGRRLVPTVGTGVAAGAGLSWLMSAWVRSVLYGVQLFDPWSAGAVLLLLLIVATAASLVPAMRAVALDPAIVLREE
jgi:ABC-type antimicrobial peptide transport system permease subunit